MTSRLVLVRHGQSTWNEANRFTGWWDADLTAHGEHEARNVGTLLEAAEILPDVVHTSLLTRAIRTANLTLDTMNRSWLPVRRHWRLNERHYGDLTGLNKEETRLQHGDHQWHTWRRSFDTPPPTISHDNAWNPNNDERYSSLPHDLIPRAECLHDVLQRVLPYWYDQIVPDLQSRSTVLVVAHGNSLRALCKHLDQITDHHIEQLEIPTGQPLVYDLDNDMLPAQPKSALERLLSLDSSLTTPQ